MTPSCIGYGKSVWIAPYTTFTQGLQTLRLLVRPQKWPGRRWRQEGGRTLALVVQGWHTGRSDIAMDAMVAVKFWACSKQWHNGHRGRRDDAQWSPRKRCVLLWTLCINLGDASAFLLPPLCHLWLTNSFHWAITEATTVSPLGAHANHWATLVVLLPQLCLHWKAQGSSYSSYTETELSGFRRPLRVLTIFWSVKGGTEVAAMCKGGLLGGDSTMIPPKETIENQYRWRIRSRVTYECTPTTIWTVSYSLQFSLIYIYRYTCTSPGMLFSRKQIENTNKWITRHLNELRIKQPKYKAKCKQ